MHSLSMVFNQGVVAAVAVAGVEVAAMAVASRGCGGNGGLRETRPHGEIGVGQRWQQRPLPSMQPHPQQQLQQPQQTTAAIGTAFVSHATEAPAHTYLGGV